MQDIKKMLGLRAPNTVSGLLHNHCMCRGIHPQGTIERIRNTQKSLG